MSFKYEMNIADSGHQKEERNIDATVSRFLPIVNVLSIVIWMVLLNVFLFIACY